jgi:hypothetical protein
MKRLKRYRYALIALALLVLLFAGWITLQSDESSRINSANFEKIRKGMTEEEEVYAILGEPPGKIEMRWTRCFFGVWLGGEPFPWVANFIRIAVYFDEEGLVDKADLILQKRSWKERHSINRPYP